MACGCNGPKPPTPSLTVAQWLYLAIMQGVGPCILDGALNGGLAWVMYHSKDAIPLFGLPDTVAGDFFVTCLVQGILTWLIVQSMVCNDIRKGVVAPLGIQPPPWVRKIAVKGLEVFRAEDLLAGPTLHGLARVLARGLLFGFLTVPPFVAVGVIVMAPIKGPYSGTPDLPIIKAVYAGIMGGLTTPLVALTTLVSMGVTPHGLSDCGELPFDEIPDSPAAELPTAPSPPPSTATV